MISCRGAVSPPAATDWLVLKPFSQSFASTPRFYIFCLSTLALFAKSFYRALWLRPARLILLKSQAVARLSSRNFTLEARQCSVQRFQAACPLRDCRLMMRMPTAGMPGRQLGDTGFYIAISRASRRRAPPRHAIARPVDDRSFIYK